MKKFEKFVFLWMFCFGVLAFSLFAVDYGRLNYLANKSLMETRLQKLNSTTILALIPQQIAIDWATYRAPVYDVQTSIGTFGVAYDFGAFYYMVASIDHVNNYAGSKPLTVYYYIKDTGFSVDYAFWASIPINSGYQIDLLWGNGNKNP